LLSTEDLSQHCKTLAGTSGADTAQYWKARSQVSS
jgi:hypothetical protein